MATRVLDVDELRRDESDLEELRIETLDLLALGALGLVLGVLALAAVDSRVRQPEIWWVVAPLLGTALATRVRVPHVMVASVLSVVSLGLAIIASAAVFPDGHFLYALPLPVVVASALLGEVFSFFVAAVTSVCVELLLGGAVGLLPPESPGTVVFLVWSTAALSWLAGRPTRSALQWSWHSYLLALRRTEELRDRQGELVRLTKSLDEACARLEDVNGELERARRAAEEARRLKAEFAASISHELRTPLNLIIGFTDTMMNAPHAYEGQSLPPLYRQDLAVIHRSASVLSQLVDDVLDLSQIDAHRLALEKSWSTLDQIGQEAIDSVSGLYERLGLGLALDAPTPLPPLFVDANRVRQILINLLNNAARFTSRGGVTVRITAEENHAVLAVADTGEGIAPPDLPYVFDEFRQVGSSDRRVGGSGLGLAICRRFAEMHGGYMRVESELGRGSTFFLVLPLSGTIINSPLERRTTLHSESRRTIAVLDREGEASKVFQRYLDGYQVIAARSLAELQRLPAEQTPCALIVSGSTAETDSALLRKSNSRLRDLPVFSCALSTSRVLAEELGVTQYLVKPVRADQILTALRQVGKHMRDVVVVEDDPDTSRMIVGFLRSGRRRYTVRQARNGAEALALLRASRPDVVLLDLLMPGLSGYDMLRQMKDDPSIRDLPVIVVSARGTHNETIRSGTLTLSRWDGLTVGEMMRCVRQSLDALLDAPVDSSPGQLAGLPA